MKGLSRRGWRRGVVLAWLFVSTGAYGVSFWAPSVTRDAAALGSTIAGGAAASWLALGLSALVATRGRGRSADEARRFIWGDAGDGAEGGAGDDTSGRGLFDVCLHTAGWGDVVLTLGTLVNVAVWLGVVLGPTAFFVAHAVVLAASGSSMTVLFFRGVRLIGGSRALAAWLWFGALQGTMLIVLVALAAPLGYASLLRGG